MVYLGTLFKEFLDTDIYRKGKNTSISRITDGRIFNDSITAIAGVANIGLDSNWCGHHFAQANWYVFGRLAWNNQLSVRDISCEWLSQTFLGDKDFIKEISGVEQTKKFQRIWNSQKNRIDTNRFKEVQNKLANQVREAIWWKDACVLYFQTFSNKPIPNELFIPTYKLEDLKRLKFNLQHHN
jgi:alpha-glucuronidase